MMGCRGEASHRGISASMGALEGQQEMGKSENSLDVLARPEGTSCVSS